MLFAFLRRHRHVNRTAAALIAIAAAIGMVDATFLILQYFAALITGGEPTPCSPNTLINCTKTVQGTWGHLVAGIPNPLLGMLWYSGFVLYGLARYWGSTFSRQARIFVGSVGLLGLVFSYTLYLASIFVLRGVCPFCLASTTLSTVIMLAFVVDDLTYDKPVLHSRWRHAVFGFQLFSTAAFVFGLPAFLAIYMPMLLDPLPALLHWSFPAMVLLVIIMATVQLWAYYQIKGALRK